MKARVNTSSGRVLRAQRAIRQAPDTRALKRELRHDNPYAIALLRARGLTYVHGSGIIRGAA